MSFKSNIIANFASQLYVTVAGFAMVPLYIKYMGAEAYGLIGFFAMLQAWFNLLDMGLTPTMARETARFNGGALDVLGYRRLARALEGVFLTIALLGGMVFFASASWIAESWLNANKLTTSEIVSALQLMAVIIALRWMCGLYRGVITGSERLVWLSGFNITVATLRFGLILPVLMFISSTPSAFFNFQLGVAVYEIVGLAWMAYHLLPAIPTGNRVRWEWAPLKPVLKFSLTIAFTSSVWVLVTQTDKLVLSKILPLVDYGYFTVAVLVASGIMILSGPISGAIMPRMTRLQAEGKHEQLVAVYRQATQLVIVVVIPVALILAFFSRQVLWVWSGDTELVEKVAPVLTLYAAGYGVLAISAFPYYLQYAKGDLKLHLIGNALFVLILIPSVIWATIHFGMTGAGWAWVVANVLYLMLWTPLVHNRFIPGMHARWLLADIVYPVSLAFASAIFLSLKISWASDRMMLAMELVGIGAVLFSLTYMMAGRVKLLNRGQGFAN